MKLDHYSWEKQKVLIFLKVIGLVYLIFYFPPNRINLKNTSNLQKWAHLLLIFLPLIKKKLFKSFPQISPIFTNWFILFNLKYKCVGAKQI